MSNHTKQKQLVGLDVVSNYFKIYVSKKSLLRIELQGYNCGKGMFKYVKAT